MSKSNFSCETFFRERHVFLGDTLFWWRHNFRGRPIFRGRTFFGRDTFWVKQFFWGRRIFGKFLTNRAEKFYTFSSKGMEGPKALHFPKFPENFPQFSNLKKLFSFLKCWSFKFFFWILIKKINSNLQEIKKTTYEFSP